MQAAAGVSHLVGRSVIPEHEMWPHRLTIYAVAGNVLLVVECVTQFDSGQFRYA